MNMTSDDILNIKEVSNYLKVPVSTIYKLAQDGKVPAIKVGKHWRFLKKDLENLFTQKREFILASFMEKEDSE
jgi:excisionase family DNA binding protein